MLTKILSTKKYNCRHKFCGQKKINVDKKFVDKKIKLSTKNLSTKILSTKKNNCRQKFCRQKNKNVDKKFGDKKKKSRQNRTLVDKNFQN